MTDPGPDAAVGMPDAGPDAAAVDEAAAPVNEILSNYQMDPSSGYLRLLRFDPSARRVHVQTYSPWLDLALTDGANDFSFAYCPALSFVPRSG